MFFERIKETISSSISPITDSALVAVCREFISKISCYLTLPEMPDIGVMKMMSDTGIVKMMPDVKILQ
ncbi:hypothetical protein NPIL_141981 [Nephila pilipes]|uniref:Uncharacterized protein n=1 Tax=Nephila pilipes TaxID=299642 RepID=A0A8X6JLR9_NEPPI|nr:hypothetical protein NPIL_141981 [Nephila pilipes]